MRSILRKLTAELSENHVHEAVRIAAVIKRVCCSKPKTTLALGPRPSPLFIWNRESMAFFESLPYGISDYTTDAIPEDERLCPSGGKCLVSTVAPQPYRRAMGEST